MRIEAATATTALAWSRRVQRRVLSEQPPNPRQRSLPRHAALDASDSGRAERRARIAVEHGIPRIHRTQGDRARDLGNRANRDDLQRHAAITNLDGAMKRAA